MLATDGMASVPIVLTERSSKKRAKMLIPKMNA
jgi:hypothetical protein